MRSGKHRRAAWASGLSLVVHVLVLTGMVVGLKVATPPPEERPIELRLIRPFEPQPRPAPSVRIPERVNTAPALRPRATPQPAPTVPTVTLPVAPAPAPKAPEAAPKTYGPEDRRASGPSGKLGCDNPLNIRLTVEQQQACANNQARLTRDAKPLDLIPADKKAEYDHYEACRNYRHSGVPGKNWSNPKDDGLPDGRPSNIDPSYGRNPGIGPGVSGCSGQY